MAGVIGALRVNLGLDSAEFLNGLNAAQKGLKGVGSKMQRIGQDLSLRVSAPIVGLGTLAVRAGADFEAAMNRIGAVTGASVNEMAALSQASRDLGRTTQFSATQAAEAVEILAKNGVSAADILGGALSASLQLAAASGSDLVTAGDLATDVMLNFGKSAGDLSAVVDGVSGVLVASKFGIEDYALAIAQAGGVAGGLGVEFEDFNAALAATSNLFASGSDAGTSFKTFLQRLVPASGPAATAMQELGLEFFNAQGEMRSMAEIAQELQDSLAGLTEEQRTDALSTIFGTDAMRTAIGLMDQGAEGINRLNEAIGQASASDQAAARMEGFSGAMRRLQSAFEGLLLAIADSGLLDILTDIAGGMTDLVNRISAADPQLVQFGVIFAGIGAAIGPVVLAIGAMVAVLGTLAGPVVLITTAIATLTAGFVAFWPEIVAAKDRIGELWSELKQSEGIIGAAATGIEALASKFREFAVTMVGIGQEIISGLIAGLTGNLEGITQAAENIGRLINDYFDGLPAKFIQIGRDIIDGLLSGLREKWESVKGWFTGLAEQIPTWIRDKLGIQSPSRVFAEIGRNIMQGLGVGLDETTPEVQGKFESAASNIGNAFGDVLTNVINGRSADIQGAISGILGNLGGNLISGGVGALGTALKIPGFADGVNNFSGGYAIVGEQGPELVNLPRGSDVVPNGEFGFGGVTLNYAPSIDARGASVEAVARLEAMMRQQSAELEQTFNTRVLRAAGDRRNRGA